MGLSSSCFLSRSNSGANRRLICLGLGTAALLLVCLGVVAVFQIPWWIETRLHASLSRKGFQQVELQVVRTAAQSLDIAGLRLARPGWTAHAAEAHLEFKRFAFLARHYQVLDLTGLNVDVDIDELLRTGALRLPTSLRALHQASQYDQVRFREAHFHLRRGGLTEHIQVTGEFCTNGTVNLQLSGDGLSVFSLTVQGELAGDRGDARIRSTLKSPSLARLLDTFVPGWLQKNPVYAVDQVELSATLNIVADRPRVTDAGGIVHWKGWKFDNGYVTPARVHAKKQGNAVVLQSEKLQLRREDGLHASGYVDATFAPEGSAEDTPFLQGRLHLDSYTAPEATLAACVIPFAGTPANLRLGPAQITVSGRHACTLRDLWVRLENPPDSPLRAEGKALLELPVPSLLPDPQPPKTLCLPATGRMQGPRGNRTLDFVIHAEDSQGKPLEVDFGPYLLQLSGKLETRMPPGQPPQEVPLHVELPQIKAQKEGRPLFGISGFSLSGLSRSHLVEAAGEGKWEGQPFPFRISQSATKSGPSSTSAVTTSLTLGPIPLREASWPGNVVKAWRGTQASGDLLLSGTLLQEPGQPAPPVQPDLTIQLRDGKLTYADGSTTATGVQAEARLVSLSPLLFAPGLSVSVNRVDLGKVELNQVRLSLTHLGPEHLRIDSFQANLLGGSIRIVEPVVISPGEPSFSVMFELTRIQGSEAIRLFPKFKGKVEASISGRVPLAVENGQVRFLEGHLYLDGSQPAHLSYDASGFLTSTKGSRSPKFTQSVERALGNLTIKSLDVRLFDPADPTHPAIVKLAGTGVSEQLNLPVNLTIPVEDEEGILQSLFSRILSAGMNVLRP